MSVSTTERRQIENEMIFRRSNEKVADAIEELDAMHREDGHPDLVSDENLSLQFKCECSDETCNVRIPMLLAQYEEIHADRDTFIVVPGHQVENIEKVIKKTKKFNIVKKHHLVSEPSHGLNTTK